MEITAKEVKTWCTGMHPKMPNKSGNARGRKLHKTLDGKKTICNMLAEKLCDTEKMHFYANGKCKICFK